MARRDGLAAAVVELQQLTERLRRDCPWDREQTAATIVPHTIEETYEVADVVRALEAGETSDLHELEDELGDLLFAVVNLCRKAGVHASVALDRANLKFARRFEAIERLAAGRGLKLQEMELGGMDALWEEVKEGE